MSEIENKSELIDKLLSEATFTTAETSNTEIPVLENLFTAQDVGTSDNLNLPLPEVINATGKAENGDDILAENKKASSSIPQVLPETNDSVQVAAEINSGLTEQSTLDNVLDSDDTNVQEPNQDDALKETECPNNDDNLDSNLQESKQNDAQKQTEIPKNFESGDEIKKANDNTENLPVTSKDVLNLEMEETLEENVSLTINDKHEEAKENEVSDGEIKNPDKMEISHSKILENLNEETKEISKENEVSEGEIKNPDKMEISHTEILENLNEETKEISKENEVSDAEIKNPDKMEISHSEILENLNEGTKEISKEHEVSNGEIKNPDKIEISHSKNLDNLNEPVKEQSESLAEITKDLTKKTEDLKVTENEVMVKDKDVIDKTSEMEKEAIVDDKDVIDKTSEMENVSTAQIEPMDTSDSQESLNLIIDEASNTTENKDDSSEVSKNDVDTNMEVVVEKVPSTDKKETDGKNLQKESEIENTSNEKEKLEPIEAQNKAKDDDVIPVEQPPVPIIEIDDEDDIEITSAEPKTIEIEETQKETPMEIDENDKASVSAKDMSSIEKDNNTYLNKVYEIIQKAEDTLLDVSSEKPSYEFLKANESDIYEDGSDDANVEIFYNKECINYECPRKHKQYLKVPQFAFSYFKVTKKKFKVQYICADCYDKALEMYEEFCGLISAKQPLLLEQIPSGRQEFVEIIDSSDDEDINDDKPVEPSKSSFAKNDLSLIEAELHNTIKSVLNKVEIQHQLTWSKTILSERLKRLQVETDFIDSELKSLQKKADRMHEGLYACPKIKIRQLLPLDLNSGKLMTFEQNLQKEIQPIPPVGEIERPPIQVNSIYYAVKNNPIASWVPCRVIEQVESSVLSQKFVKNYKIKYIKNQIQIPKTVPGKYLAYHSPPTVRLPIGTRVIAYFDATSLARGREKINVQSAFYPGIIAEPLKPNNKFRYLIFYDDGYTQYVYHKDVRLVCHVSDCVWEDVHPASRDFIQKYLTQYSINRPMVQTQKGQSMNTESNGYWLHARVVDIDCSLVLMQFEGSKSHTEWIYRGSLRLGPVFKEYQKSLQKNSTVPVSRLPRRTEPFIRYTEDEENTSQQQAEKSNESSRAVARKTFGRPDSMMNSGSSSQQQQPQPTVKHLNNSTIYVEDENKPKGKVVYYTAKRNLPPRKYRPHSCSPSCLFEITHNLSAYSPLSKPLLSGWERFIIRQKIKRVVTYRAPCGKIMRNMKELHHYLRATKNVLNVDNFDFSHETNCLAEYVIESAIVQKRDISGGQEKMAIPLVNYYDNTLPPECKYSAKVIPTEGVHINKDPAFLVGCDCEDDCIDKNKCACWQLTLAGAKYGNPNAAPEEVGYQYRRLLDHVPTGIYECNVNCKCKSSCLNRVVQNSLTMKLQVFKTSNRGWGLRCINDIPRGSFVCVYAGHLLTEAKANEGGQDAGDEYFAELDYIEVAEQIKEGYESEVELPEPEEEESYNPEIDDDEFTPSKSWMTRAKQRQNASKTTRSSNQEEDSQERQVINFNPNADMNEDSGRENSIRKLYGRDEACYVMDAKISGNLGRYFNHSCSPNMFVQNVFVETHDLRFPNVAFFSSCNIRAGTELTWNYNYEVGVVPGKVLYCQCGAPNCRLRLL